MEIGWGKGDMSQSKYFIYEIFDEPVPYKSLLIYPATVRDYLLFLDYSSCLLVDKNSIPDPNIISMNYMEFLYYATNEQNLYAVRFRELLAMVLKKDRKDIWIGYDENRKPIFKIGDDLFNNDDFDQIRSIIIEQNLLEPPDENIQKEIRDKIEEAERLKQKINNNKMAGLEDLIICVIVATGLTVDDIKKLTVRKWGKLLERINMRIDYQIFQTAKYGGFVEFKDKSFPKHWMSETKKDELSGLIDLDSVKNKTDFSDQKIGKIEK